MRRVMRASLWTLLFIAVGVAVALKLLAPAGVMTVAAGRGLLAAEVFGTGTLESKVVVGISSKVVGKVTQVLVDQGDVVVPGQTMARLEAADYLDAVRVAEAQLHVTEAELAKASLDVKRIGALHEGRVVADAEMETADTDFHVAQARVGNSQAALGVARAKLADTQIVSEFPGLVITRNLEVGATVVPGAPIFRVADTRVLWVQAMVDERETGRLRLGQPVRVVFGANPDSSTSGRVARLSAETDRVTEEREVDVTLDRVPPGFFLGQKADVFIETARHENALQIPKSTLSMRGGKPGVFIVDRGRARWRPVQLGLRGRDLVEVTSGVDERDRLIVNPQAGKKPLADGQRVRATAASGKP